MKQRNVCVWFKSRLASGLAMVVGLLLMANSHANIVVTTYDIVGDFLAATNSVPYGTTGATLVMPTEWRYQYGAGNTVQHNGQYMDINLITHLDYRGYTIASAEDASNYAEGANLSAITATGQNPRGQLVPNPDD